MDRENLQNATLLAVGVVLLLIPAFLVPAPVLQTVAYGAVLVALALGVAASVWRFSLGTVQATPSETTRYLVRTLRMAGHVVRAEQGGLFVAIGHEALVRLRVEAADGTSRVVYQAGATVAGWVSLVRLPGIYRRVRTWGQDASTRFIPPGGRLPAPPSQADTRAMLIDALSETHRLAAEAYASERERYQNAQALVILAAIIGWFLLFLALNSWSSEADVNSRMAAAAGWAFVVTLSTSVPSGWLIRRFRRGRIVTLRDWAARLENALRAESGARVRETPRESSLELLLESHRQVPQWLEIARNASVSVDPMGWWALFTMVYFGVELLLWQAPAVLPLSFLLGALIGMGGIALLVGAGLYYRRWKRRREEAMARSRADWDRSYRRLRGEMETFLGRI